MNYRDMVSGMSVLGAKSAEGAGDMVTPWIDLRGYRAAAIVAVTEGGAGAKKLKVEHATVAAGTDAANCTEDDLIHSGSVAADGKFGEATGVAARMRVGYAGSRRYVRATFNPGTGGNSLSSVVVLGGEPAFEPTADQI